MIQMSNVSKIYGTRTVALSNISVKIEQGEFVFIVGPSGAGKSTFIKLIFMEETATSGDIVINGRNLADLTPKDIPYLRRHIGVVFQDFRLLPNKTVYDNVAFAMRVTEQPRREIQKRIPLILELVGLRHKARVYPNELSGGEQQRVAIARAIVNNPAVVVADEPTGNLDPETSLDIMSVLERVNRAGATVVMATHDKSVVDSMKKRVIAFERSRIVRDQAGGPYGYEN
ncbi:MAG: cell division ATP-binding protein FtsE [Sporomusaceae bacterium]|nr:cell division ATP-binding protein FtsE [Sporomusaceae bacterium]